MRYRLVDTRRRADGLVRIALDQTLRVIATTGGAREVQVVSIAHSVDGSPEARAYYDAMLAPFHGTAMRVRIDDAGELGAVIEADRTWTTLLASLSSPLTRARRAQFAAMSMPARADRIRQAVAALLPPPLPALRLGERRDFRDENGREGNVALTTVTPDMLGYRVERRGRRADQAIIERTDLAIAQATGLLRWLRTTSHAVTAAGEGPDLERSELHLLE